MKAMVLCAGHGTRLGELTREVPKPMLPLQGRPMLEYILLNLRRHGFDEIAINLHFQPRIIQDYFGDGSRWQLKLSYSHEPELLGTAGGVKKMEPFLRNAEGFLVHYGDVVTDQDFGQMWQFHRALRGLVTLLLHQRRRSNSLVMMDDGNRVVGFLERPEDNQRAGRDSNWVNSGVCICSPEVLEAIPKNAPADLPRDIFPKLIGGGRVFGFPLTGYRCSVDSPERYADAQAALEGGRWRVPGLDEIRNL